MKKKKNSEMTQKEIQEELAKVVDELESLAPNLVGSLIKLNKSFYALSKDEKARELVMRDKDFRKRLLKLASVANDLERTLFQADEITRQKLKELEKKRDSERKD